MSTLRTRQDPRVGRIAGIVLLIAAALVGARMVKAQPHPAGDTDRSQRGYFVTDAERTFIVAADPDAGRSNALYDGATNRFDPLLAVSGKWCTTTGAACLQFESGSSATARLHVEQGGSHLIARRVAIGESDIAFTYQGVRHRGHVWAPTEPGAHPAVVLLGGTGDDGPDDFRIYPYLLARAGFTAFAFDKGGGDARWSSEEGIRPLAAEALAAVDRLKALPGVDARHVGLLGISHGAWVAIEAAHEDPSVAFVIAIVGGGIPLWRATLYETDRKLADAGYPRPDVRAADRFMRKVMNALSRRRPDLLPALIRSASGRRWFKDTPLAPFSQLPPSQIVAIARQRWAGELAYDPSAALRAIRVPVLAISAERDRSVPGRANLAAIARLSARCATTVLLRNANHRQALADVSGFVYAPQLVPAIDDWLSRTGRATSCR